MEMNGKQSLLPAFYDDDSSIVCDSIAGGANSTHGMPNELTLQHERAGKKTIRGRFTLIKSSLYEHAPDAPEPEPFEKPLIHEEPALEEENKKLRQEISSMKAIAESLYLERETGVKSTDHKTEKP